MSRTTRAALLMAGLLAVPLNAWAETRVWLIGGGNTLANSQGQIEENVRWLEQIFAQRGIETRTYFTDGGDDPDSHDVIYFASPGERDPMLEPILRVFGSELAYAKKTRRNTLTNVVGTTEKDSLTASLKRDFDGVRPEDSVLIVYNGHGGIDTDDTLNNSLMLWQDTRLNITELGQLLDHTAPEAEVRFVLTQCFSGSFSSLIYENPRSDTMARQSRCGFLAESDRRESEGCDLGTNQDEFRDYTTYFFAALNGKTRMGEPIPLEQIDLDGSGTISYHEAHLYTLREAHSSDLSRSTSEIYLDQWEPWYLRWNSFGPNKLSNDYAQAEKTVTEKHQLPDGGLPAVAHKRDMTSEEAALLQQRNRLSQEVRELQAAVRGTLNAGDDFTHQSLEPDELRALSDTITADGRYASLVTLQERVAQLDRDLLTQQRNQTQLDKARRLARLARLTSAFSRYADEHARADMAQLRECEWGTID